MKDKPFKDWDDFALLVSLCNDYTTYFVTLPVIGVFGFDRPKTYTGKEPILIAENYVSRSPRKTLGHPSIEGETPEYNHFIDDWEMLLLVVRKINSLFDDGGLLNPLTEVIINSDFDRKVVYDKCLEIAKDWKKEEDLSHFFSDIVYENKFKKK